MAWGKSFFRAAARGRPPRGDRDAPGAPKPPCAARIPGIFDKKLPSAHSFSTWRGGGNVARREAGQETSQGEQTGTIHEYVSGQEKNAGLARFLPLRP